MPNFWRTGAPRILKNTMIDLWPKILLLRTHHLWNSTTELILNLSIIVNAHKLWFITLASKAYQIDILGNQGSARMFYFLFLSDSAIYGLPMNTIRDHPFKTSTNVHDFWPLPSSVGIFYYYPSVNLANFWPLPLKNADVLNGWSQRKMFSHDKFRKLYQQSTLFPIIFAVQSSHILLYE